MLTLSALEPGQLVQFKKEFRCQVRHIPQGALARVAQVSPLSGTIAVKMGRYIIHSIPLDCFANE